MGIWKKIIGGLCISIGALVLGVALTRWYLDKKNTLFSPVSTSSQFQFVSLISRPRSSSPKQVLGFLPYWNLDEVVFHQELTHLAYFSLTIEPDGSILSRTGNSLEPGYRTFNSSEFQNILAEWQDMPQAPELVLVITQFDKESIEQFLSDPEAQNTFFTTLDSLVNAYPITGLNIDFEPVGEISPTTRNQFTTFMANLNEHAERNYSRFSLSVDVYASAMDNPTLWDIPALAEEVDSIVIMAYDFHRRTSPAAGPVAPVFGGQQFWEKDISLYLADFITHVDRKKLLLGIPFYGYEWQTTSTAAQAPTYPNTGRTASYKYIQNLLADPSNLNLQQWWNEAALSPYVTYEEQGKFYTIYYDDARSLAYKIELVNQLDLGGIAIWALGYEGPSRDLWDVIGNMSK